MQKIILDGVCTCCGVRKERSDFYRNGRGNCIQCSLEKSRARYRKNADAVKLRISEYRKENPEKVLERSRAWREKNPDRVAKYKEAAKRTYQEKKEALALRSRLNYLSKKELRLEQQREWSRNNKAKVAARRARKTAGKLQATPAWANKFFVDEIYDLSRLRSELTGIRWHVDHSVPLRSELVCGLHVEHNLRVIPAPLNHRKSNRWWPDMPKQESNHVD